MVVTWVLDLSSCDSTGGSNRKRAAIQLCSAAAVMTDITDTFQETSSSQGGETRQEIRENLGRQVRYVIKVKPEVSENQREKETSSAYSSELLQSCSNLNLST